MIGCSGVHKRSAAALPANVEPANVFCCCPRIYWCTPACSSSDWQPENVLGCSCFGSRRRSRCTSDRRACGHVACGPSAPFNHGRGKCPQSHRMDGTSVRACLALSRELSACFAFSHARPNVSRYTAMSLKSSDAIFSNLLELQRHG